MSLPYSKILVTGGAGFIGSFTVDALIKRGYRLAVFDNFEPQVHSGHLPRYLNSHAEFISGDIRDIEALKKALNGVDAVIHLAAMVGVGQSMFQVKRYVDVNSGGTANLLDALANGSHTVKKIVVASSMSIYGEGRYQTKDGRVVEASERTEADLAKRRWDVYDPKSGEPLIPMPTDEEKPLRCASIYAITKKNQEEQVMVFGRAHGIPSVALRYFNTYGPRQSLNNPYTGVAAIFLNRIKCGEPLLIFEDGNQQRDFVSVHDVVQANLLALEKREADHDVFNVGSGRPISIKALGEVVLKTCGKTVPIDVNGKYRKGDIRHCYADITKIRMRLGYEPKVTMPEGLRELIEASQGEKCEGKADFRMGYLEERKLVV
jgi:dTDP-L-rhamnose 4-epimerase